LGTAAKLSGTLTFAGEGATPFAGNGQPVWNPEAQQWDLGADDKSWGWLTEFYGAHNRHGWNDSSGGFYQGPFVPEHAAIALSDGTKLEFGYRMAAPYGGTRPTGENMQVSVFPATGPYLPGWGDETRAEGGYATWTSLEGDRAFSARETDGVNFIAKGLKLGPSVNQ
jgi:hypothetical protein